MIINYEKAFLFTAGLIVGAGAVCFAKSGKGRKAAIAITSKGLELKDRVAEAAGRFKETAEDVLAEAQYLNEQKTKTSEN